MTLRLALTPGEPAGIGPDITIQTIQNGSDHELVAFADPEMLINRAKLLGLPLSLREISVTPHPLRPGELAVHPISMAKPAVPGMLEISNAHYVIDCLDQAILACESQNCSAVVTGPVQKSIINQAGIEFSGHTEHLAKKTKTERVVMMLASSDMRVALATTHLPLKSVASSITEHLLRSVIDILYRELQKRFGISYPKIMVCGLNPHAGESGHLGTEEVNVITPLLREMRRNGKDILGPLPADTIFTRKFIGNADVVLAMYHDQGLPVLKYQSFGQAANITLGLPIIRTSVDHGTALDVAGTGLANAGSLEVAVKMASEMSSRVPG